jgi:hypothetical protein
VVVDERVLSERALYALSNPHRNQAGAKREPKPLLVVQDFSDVLVDARNRAELAGLEIAEDVEEEFVGVKHSPASFGHGEDCVAVSLFRDTSRRTVERLQ